MIFEAVRKATGFKGHHIETGFAILILCIVALISGKGWVEWVGVFGVALTFEYQVLSTYLREHSEALRRHHPDAAKNSISKEIQIIYYLKECVWVLYFVFLGAYSALAGTVLFILYGIWRRLYRHVIPLEKEDLLL